MFLVRLGWPEEQGVPFRQFIKLKGVRFFIMPNAPGTSLGVWRLSVVPSVNLFVEFTGHE